MFNICSWEWGVESLFIFLLLDKTLHPEMVLGKKERINADIFEGNQKSECFQVFEFFLKICSLSV